MSKIIEAKLPPSISGNLIDLFPASSAIVGKISTPETGILDSELLLIPGPAGTSGT